MDIKIKKKKRFRLENQFLQLNIINNMINVKKKSNNMETVIMKIVKINLINKKTKNKSKKNFKMMKKNKKIISFNRKMKKKNLLNKLDIVNNT